MARDAPTAPTAARSGGRTARRDCGNRRESEESVSSALNQNSNGIAAAGMAGPAYVNEPPLSPPSPRASAQAPAPPPQQPERPVLEVAPDPVPVAVVPAAPAPPAPAPAEPETPAGLPLEGLLIRFGLIPTEQLTEAMRDPRATGKDSG